MKEIWLWISLTILCIGLEAFFTMSEMSFVSFDRVRLHFLEAQGHKRAKLLLKLLQKPIYLFGTTLIGVSFALITGSECSRQLYSAIGLPEGLAPITQVLLVVMFAELTPLLAARRHFQSVAFFCVPIISFLSKVFYPLLLIIAFVSKGLNMLLRGKKESSELVLTREELQNILERVHTKKMVDIERLEGGLIQNIFKLKHKPMSTMITPLGELLLVPKTTPVSSVKTLLKANYMPYVLVYDQVPTKITKIVFSKELVQKNQQGEIDQLGKLPWFVTQDVNALELLKQLRSNMRVVACILDAKANAIGTVQIEDIFEELFPRAKRKKSKLMRAYQLTIDADLTVQEFNEQFHTHLEASEEMTLQELMLDKLGHVPKEGDTIMLEHLEIKVLDANVFSTKTLSVRSILE